MEVFRPSVHPHVLLVFGAPLKANIISLMSQAHRFGNTRMREFPAVS